ncbi:hypothetical protein ADL22_29345 [Streptomyces sp. NRRL F-4489]|uniref:hypothetical protein n=1 Tax=Streptomyces sp. NRRL F-4489 TaxID=1609095 RepID=UPI0007471B54|nr:hypothetical protein [Streptomyces sp. NRRL F-4489]KUL34926.1 hypothetical protein ADL22_29345 [Streptomyces sp. NRRL F-4489]
MSDGAPVDPSEVPVFTGDLDLLESKVKSLSHGGPKVETAGSAVHTSFGGLSAFYKAPEAEQLFAVTKPVADTARDVSHDMRVIAGALGTYAHEIRPLVNQLKQLQQDAADFRHKVEGSDDDWREDSDLIEENLARRNKIAQVWAAFQAAERDCHAKIVGLVGGQKLHTLDAAHKSGYGYDAKTLTHSPSLPWGEAVEESVPWWKVWDHAYDFGKGVLIDGAGGAIKGLLTLVGVDGWDAAGKAWKGLAKLSTTAGLLGIMPAAAPLYLMTPGRMLPSWFRDARTAMLESGKAFVAWDQWQSNGSRAAGAVTFNVLTALITRGGGAAVEGATKAGAAARAASMAGKVGEAIDPMTYLFKGAGTGVSKISDVMAHLKNTGHLQVPKISEGAFSLPEGAVKLPDGTVQLPKGTAIPEGATKLPDDRIKLPEGTVDLPPNTVKDPATGKYMSGRGDLYNEDGTLFQHAEDAPKAQTTTSAAGADTPRTETPVRQEQPVLAGVGGRGDDAVPVGSDVPGRAHGGVGPGGSRPDDGIRPISATNHDGPSSTGSTHTPNNDHIDASPLGGRANTEAKPVESGHGTGVGQDAAHQGGHGNAPYSGHEEPTSSDANSGGGAGSGHDSHGTDAPGTPDEPSVHLEGDSVAQQPLGKMAPEQEDAVLAALTESKVPPADQERMLIQLRKSGYGGAVAEYIAGGRFSDCPGYKDLIFQVKQRDMMPAVHQALEHAADLQTKGVGNIEFELKLPDENLDLDVLVRSENGIEYGAQLKDLQSANGIKSAVTKIAKAQLAGPGVKVKAAILDIDDVKGSLTERMLNIVHRAADRTNASFELRFKDGSFTVFPTNATKP